ncbi:hypothetical protein SUGI_0286820 [Cryptomeria japonica]|uniref:TMV resistance protein N n=1 Tax=Cryptomeria japonica TaxID=3369 RepID=UPI00240892AC|nr:TMV resistance protein N [Cryptomeria japonica]GLJ16696.1 hypothetical protein SUGI_0286820 [Cryptomeria japonica]
MATTNAFEKILPPSTAASTSASSSCPPKRARYDVFINHRGPDTKKTLAASIYDTLKPLGVEVFLDEAELELGDSIPSEIQEAMKSSFLHIAILSPRYAESPWCLAELSVMVNTGKPIIPVFYNVDPSKIHWICQGKGIYAEDFSEHEAKGRYSPGTLEDWKVALERVSYLTGHIVNSENDEELLKTIENYVLEHPKKISFVVAEHPVGLDETLLDFESSVFESSSKNVKIVGITGMGGCGKTTLAKEYYNKKKHYFYRCSFVSNVRNVVTKKLHETQKKLFQDLGGLNDISFDSVEEGKAILTEHLRSVKVFIVLDDVDHLNQLESLLPIKDGLRHDSLIVITSRDFGLFTSWGIPYNSIYKVKELNFPHAIELFCWHAFPQPFEINEFEYLIKRFLEVCRGLPLSLKVLGGLVRGKSKEYWDAQLKEVSGLLPEDIRSILNVSFDSLCERDKDVFLDISCFFIGTETDSAITVWDGCGWSGVCSLKRLVEKCLVEVDRRNYIRMHDQLRDLGRQIAETRAPYRLWSPQQITHIIEKQGEESVSIRGIKAQSDEFYEEFVELVRESGKEIKGKRSLKILDIENDYLTEELATLSADPFWLRWVNFPHTILPPWISLKKLRALELREASKLEEPWSEIGDVPVQLRVLKIIHAESFQRFPRSIGFLKHLQKISFYGKGAPIEALPEEFCHLHSLEYLKLVGCDKLKSLPSKFGDLINLRLLKLTKCSGIEGLPEEFCHLQSLEYLKLARCDKLKSLPSKFGDLINLRRLKLTKCSGIEGLPEEFCRLQPLKYLKLDGCDKLKSLPSKFGDLTNLLYLEIYRCNELTIASGTLAQLFKLTSLYLLRIDNCSGLTELVIQPGCLYSAGGLKYMVVTSCSVSRISISPQCCPSLRGLYLVGNHDLVEIDSLPTSVTDISFCNCSKLESINLNCGLLRLENLTILGCGELRRIEGLENCRSLDILRKEVIQSLKIMESLRWEHLGAARDISEFVPCFQTINRENWPERCTVRCNAAPGVEAKLECFTFPGLTLARNESECVFPEELSSSEALMICLVINSASDYESSRGIKINSASDDISLKVPKYIDCASWNYTVYAGKWVYIGVLKSIFAQSFNLVHKLIV